MKSKGETLQMTATVAPENAENKEVTWTSSNPEVATVDENGVVTAVGKGRCTITVTTVDGGKTDTGRITVKLPEEETPEDPETPENPGTTEDPGTTENPGTTGTTTTSTTTTANRNAKTGDATAPVALMLLMTMSMMGFAGLYITRRKRK